MLRPHVTYKSTYRLVEAFRHISPNEVREVVDEQLIELCFLGAENDELVFSAQQLESNKIFFPETLNLRLETDLLFKRLVFVTDTAGTIKRVVNKAEIDKNWGLLKNKLKAKYKKGVLAVLTAEIDYLLKQPNELEKLVGNSKYGFLLVDSFDASMQEEYSSGEKHIDYFLEQHSLPLITSNSLISPPAEVYAHKIETVGILDKEKFNQKSFAKWLKKKVDIYDLKVEVVADFEQRYILDRYQKITYAEQFLSTEVAGCYSQTRARTLEILA